MIDHSKLLPSHGVAAILLAAGKSTRFGRSKLTADLNGQTVSTRTALSLLGLNTDWRFAICAERNEELAGLGFDVRLLDPPGAPLSTTIALGVKAAQLVGARSILIALADMPLVPISHFQALLDAFDGDRIASRADETAMPPAIFGAQHFGDLLALRGDRGAGKLLHEAPTISLPRGAELDIDTPQDLQRARNLFR